MGDGSLSQEEIDALLQGADDLGASLEPERGPEAPPQSAGMSDAEIDQIRSLAEEMAESMANTLSTITSKTATLEVARVDVMMQDAFASQFSGKVVQVEADFTQGTSGLHSYVLAENPAGQVAGLMMAQESGELTDMALSALTEGFSQMSAAANSVISNSTGLDVQSGDLDGSILEDPSAMNLPAGEFVRVRYNFTADGSASTLDEIFDMNAARALAGSSMKESGLSPVAPQPGPAPQASFEPGFQQAPAVFSSGGGGGSVGVQPVQFAPLSQGQQPGTSGNIGLLMDVSMQLTVELGRTKMLIKDILGMGEGTIVELDKLAGEPVDLLVNGKLIAKGEVVVIDENFGVRVTDIISPMERISNLE
jgi:flagellar motor switch protein FliN/FliY